MQALKTWSSRQERLKHVPVSVEVVIGKRACVRGVSLEDGFLQIAIKTGVDDQFAGLGAQMSAKKESANFALQQCR